MCEVLDRGVKNKLAKLGDAIAISNLKLSITDPLTAPSSALSVSQCTDRAEEGARR